MNGRLIGCLPDGHLYLQVRGCLNVLLMVVVVVVVVVVRVMIAI